MITGNSKTSENLTTRHHSVRFGIGDVDSSDENGWRKRFAQSQLLAMTITERRCVYCPSVFQH